MDNGKVGKVGQVGKVGVGPVGVVAQGIKMPGVRAMIGGARAMTLQ